MNRPAWLAICLLSFSSLCSPAQKVSKVPTESYLAKIFRKTSAQIRPKTGVPIRFPSRMPPFDKGEVYAIVLEASEHAYSVILASTPDCKGQHVCSWVSLRGTTDSADQIAKDFKDRRKVQVTLQNGARAVFYDMSCGAYCDESWIVWTEGKFRYIIGIKAGTKVELIRAANSAINAGTERSQ